MPRAPFHLPAIKAALADSELRSCDLARAVGLKDSTLLAAVAPGLRTGELVRRQEGRSVFYALGDGTPPVPNPDEAANDDTADEDVRWAHWDDGSIELWGLLEDADVSVTIPAKVVAAIKARIAWSPAQ